MAIINQEDMNQALHQAIKHEQEVIVEEHIAKAVADFERVLRQKLAAKMMGYVEREVDMAFREEHIILTFRS